MKTPRIEETIARDLLHQLEIAFAKDNVNVSFGVGGVNCNVDVGSGVLNCSIHCVLMLDMRGNAHLSQMPQQQKLIEKQDAQYLVRFNTEDQRQATGRTQDSREVEDAVRDWVIQQFDLHKMHKKYAFVDAHYRAVNNLIEQINIELSQIGSTVYCLLDSDFNLNYGRELVEAWAYAGERSCQLKPGDLNTIQCVLLEKRTPLAIGSNLSYQSAARAISLWMDKNQSTNQVQEVVANVVPVEFADVFERGEYAAWHWHNVLKQVSNDDSVGAFYAVYLPIYERIPNSQYIKNFFSFTSYNILRFSNCSLYPFDTDNLPTLSPFGDLTNERPYVLGWTKGKKENSKVCNAQEAFDSLEEILSVQVKTPYFGSLTDQLVDRVNSHLIDLGSQLRAQAVQKLMRLEVQVKNSNGRIFEVSPAFGKEKVMLQSLDGEWLTMNIRKAAEKIISGGITKRSVLTQIQDRIRKWYSP